MSVLGSAFGTTQGLTKNDNGTLRVGNRLPSSTPPKGEVVGDIWYDTSTSTLKVWNGTLWVGVASGGGIVTPGFEIYHPASTPYIDFHRAANPAGDSNADFNVRFINDASNVLRLATLNPPNNNNGGRMHIGNAYIGSHPVHGGGNWAAFGHENLLGSGDYAYMHNASGDTLLNSGGSAQVIRFFINGATEIAHFNTTRCRFPNKINVGGNDFTDPESITVTGGASGISYRDRSDNSQRWVTYTTNSNFFFWDGSTERAAIARGDGRATFGLGTNGRTDVGPWTGGNNYAHFSHRRSTEQFVNWYTVLAGNPDLDRSSYFSCAPNGAVWIRRDNGVQNLDLKFSDLVGLGGGTAVTYQVPPGSQQVGYNVSSGKHKQNVRTLKNTPDPDSGPNSPIFKLRPTRFKWKHDPKGKNGVANGKEINDKFPNGVAGLIAEEVYEVCPDAVVWYDAEDERDWDIVRDGVPPIDPETGKPKTKVPAHDHMIMGLDQDRLITYLVDAVQHLKEELDTLKERKDK